MQAVEGNIFHTIRNQTILLSRLSFVLQSTAAVNSFRLFSRMPSKRTKLYVIISNCFETYITLQTKNCILFCVNSPLSVILDLARSKRREYIPVPSSPLATTSTTGNYHMASSKYLIKNKPAWVATLSNIFDNFASQKSDKICNVAVFTRPGDGEKTVRSSSLLPPANKTI